MLSLLDRREQVEASECSYLAVIWWLLRVVLERLLLVWRMTGCQTLERSLGRAFATRFDLTCIDAVNVGILLGRQI